MRATINSLTIRWTASFSVLLALIALSGNAAPRAEPKIDVAVGTGSDAFIVDATMDVPVPLEVAWDVFVDIDHATAFLQNLSLSKIVSRSGNILVARQEGAARFGLLSFNFVTEREIRLDPMRGIVTRQLTGTMKKMQSEATFSVADPGVHVRYHAEIAPDSVLARLFGQSFVRHEVIEQLALLAKEMMRRQDQRCPLPCRE